MARDLRTKLSKSILQRLVNDSAHIQIDQDGIYLEWGVLPDDPDDLGLEPQFYGFELSQELFERLKRDGLIKLQDRDDFLETEWWEATDKAGAMLYPEKAKYYGC